MRRGQTGAAEKDEKGVVINTRSRRSADTHTGLQFPPIRASHITSAYSITSVTSGATSSNSRSGGKERVLAHSFSPRWRQLRSRRPFEARSRSKLRDRRRDVKPWMNELQTA